MMNTKMMIKIARNVFEYFRNDERNETKDHEMYEDLKLLFDVSHAIYIPGTVIEMDEVYNAIILEGENNIKTVIVESMKTGNVEVYVYDKKGDVIARQDDENMKGKAYIFCNHGCVNFLEGYDESFEYDPLYDPGTDGTFYM